MEADGRLSVLVVDDEPRILSALCRTLRREGYELLTSETVEEALRVGTIHGAYASFEEKLKGSIEAGKLADMVVLARDPLRVEPSTLIQIPVERTMVGGRWTFEA